MKANWVTAFSVCVAGIGVVQAADHTSLEALPSHKPDAVVRPCLLGSNQCLDVNKIPVTACRVTDKDAKSKKAWCAVDGMTLIGKLTL